MSGTLPDEVLSAWLLPPDAPASAGSRLLRLLRRRVPATAALLARLDEGALVPQEAQGLSGRPGLLPASLQTALAAAPRGILAGPDVPGEAVDGAWMGAPGQRVQVVARFEGFRGGDLFLALAGREALPPDPELLDDVADLLRLARDEVRWMAGLRDSVRELEAGLLTATGEDFFAWLTRYVADILDVRCALVGEVVGPRWDAVQVLSVHLDGAPAEPFRYQLEGTPCARVVGREPRIFPERVQELFPEDPLLAELGMECYAGVPLFGSHGEALGLLVTLDGRPSLGGRRDQVLALLARFASRAAAELERRRLLEEFEALVEATARPVGERPAALARSLARGLRVRGAWLAAVEPSPGAGTAPVLTTRSLVWDGELRELAPVPGDRILAEAAAGRDRLVLEGGEMVGGDALPGALPGRPVHGQAVEILRDRQGEPLGLLALLDDRSPGSGVFGRSIFRAVASLVAAEFERAREEERRIRAERRALETQRLESLGSFAGSLAHDFNNLLVGVLGNLSLISQDLPEGGALRRLVEDAEQAAQRAADLTRQLLAYSGRGRFVVVPVDLGALVQELAGLLRATLPRDAELHLDLAPALPRILADASLLRRAILNLVRNAGEALGGGGGVVRIGTGRAELDEEAIRSLDLAEGVRPGEHVFLEVTDTGAGMDEATRARAFEPFYSTRAAGRGLGLAAVQGIARGHRGGIQVRSAPGAGTSVRLYLPVADILADLETPQEPAPEAGASSRVLVVDDEASVRAVAGRMLQRLGLAADSAADGEEGLGRYFEVPGRYALVLLDLTMPRLDGEQTLRRLRERDPGARVLLMSGYSAEEAAERFRDLGPVAFLQKPFRLADLRERLEEVLGRRFQD